MTIKLFDDVVIVGTTQREKGDCPTCDGAGRIRVNVTEDPTTGTWDYDEAHCVVCDGTGLIPARANYETFTLPGSARVQWKCLWCSCCVDPLVHLPGSDDCRRAEQERLSSVRDDPWAEAAS